MHWTALLEKRRFPPEASVIDDLSCVGCGYNLRGLYVIGLCPECAKPVEESLVVLAEPQVVATSLRSIARTYPVLLLLLFGCVNFLLGWPMVIVAVGLTTASVFRTVAIGILRYRGGLDRMPLIGPRISTLWWLAILELGFSAVLILTVFFAASNPVLPSAVARLAIIAVMVGWCTSTLALMGAIGWSGLALVRMLEYDWLRWEWRFQMFFVAATPVLWGLVTTLALLAQSRWEIIGLLTVLILFGALATVTSVSLFHLANAAEQGAESRDDVVDVIRQRDQRPRETTARDQDQPPSIPLE